MALVFKIAGVTVPTEAVLQSGDGPIQGGIIGLPSAAWYGEPSSASLIIDDPNGIYDDILMQPWVTFTADETADVGKERIFTGWLNARRISRGGYGTGAARIWEATIVDQNALFSFEVFRASSAKRPAESDIERADFCRTSAAMAATPLHDNGLWNVTDNPINFGDSDYVGQFPAELMHSIAGTSGKNFYAYWDDDAGEISGFYDLVSATPTAGIKVSNVRADYDPGGSPPTFFPYLDGEMDLNPDDYYTGELLQYRGAYAYGRRQATIDATEPSDFSPDGLFRDISVSTDRIGLLASANAKITADLDRMSNEQSTITVTIRVPADFVNECQAGTALPIKLTHIPGFEDFVEIPIIRRNVIPSPGRRDTYDVYLELNAGTQNSSPGGGDPGDFPPDPVTCDIGDVAIVQDDYGITTESPPATYHGTWSSAPTEGNMLVAAFLSHTNLLVAGDLPGWTWQTAAHVVALGGQAKLVTIFTKIAGASEPTDVPISFVGLSGQGFQYQLQEWSGVDTVDVTALVENEPGASDVQIPITPTPGGLGVIVASYAYDGPASTGPIGGLTIDSERGVGPPLWVMGHLLVPSASGTYTVGFTSTGFHSGAYVALMLVCSGSSGTNACPDAGQWTDWQLLAEGDGTTSQFTLACPYADGGLLVKVDNLDITLGLTETDPAAGVFDLDFAPKGAEGDAPAEQVWVKYQGR